MLWALESPTTPWLAPQAVLSGASTHLLPWDLPPFQNWHNVWNRGCDERDNQKQKKKIQPSEYPPILCQFEKYATDASHKWTVLPNLVHNVYHSIEMSAPWFPFKSSIQLTAQNHWCPLFLGSTLEPKKLTMLNHIGYAGNANFLKCCLSNLSSNLWTFWNFLWCKQ